MNRKHKERHSHELPNLVAQPTSEAAKPGRSLRPVGFAAAAVTGSVLIALLLVETGMRVLGIRPERHEKSYNVVVETAPGSPTDASGQSLVKRPSEFRGKGIQMGEWVPGTKFKTVYSTNPRGTFDADNSVPSEINQGGFRGRPVTREKPDGTYRILGLGDSFTFGIGVRDQDTFLRKLESSLNNNPTTAGLHFEVMNTGVEGHNTLDEVITLEHRWLQYNPDLILLTFYLNDAYSDYTFLNRGEELGLYILKEKGLAQYSYLWDYVQHVRSVREQSSRIQEFYKSQYFARPGTALEGGNAKGDWQASRRALAHAAGLAKARNIPLVLVVFPELYELNDKYPFAKVHELVRTAAAELSIPVLDLLDTFRGQPAHKLWVHPSDHHPNETAHELAAEAIEAFLRKEMLR